jgi:hypothetical protein
LVFSSTNNIPFCKPILFYGYPLAKKNLDLWKSSLCCIPFGISKKDNINKLRRLKTEFIKTNLPLYDNIFPIQHLNLFFKFVFDYFPNHIADFLWCIRIPRYLKGYRPKPLAKSSVYCFCHIFASP